MTPIKYLRSHALVAALLAAPLASAWPAAVPAVLEHAAIMSPKALGAAMLAATRAGARLVAVGERGTILWSDNDGVAWHQAQVPVQVSLTAVQFVDAAHGWAVGHEGVVLHTADGGKTWVKQLDGIQAAALTLAAASTAAGQAREQTPELERALRNARRLVKDGPDKPFLDVHFDNAHSGYVIGAYNLVFKTVDGGKTWLPWQAHVANPRGFHLYAMRAAGGDLFLAGEQGTLLRSDDHGEHFLPLAAPYKGSFFGLVTTHSGTLIAFGLRGNAFRSDDLGNSWQKIATLVDAALSSGMQLADGAVVLVSQAGDVLVSRDDGRSFARRKGTQPLPLAAVAQAPDASLILAGLRGMKRLPPAQQ